MVPSNNIDYENNDLKTPHELESLSDSVINRRAGLSDQHGTPCNIVPLWYFSSGSRERATEQQSYVFLPVTNHGNRLR